VRAGGLWFQYVSLYLARSRGPGRGGGTDAWE
jgi:hypothetical protein